MSSPKPKAKFFCEFCDTEVPADAIVCPKCGHFFSAVVCPKCGHTGNHKEFIYGCKVCGYAFTEEKEKAAINKTEKQPKLPPKARRKTRKNALKAISSREDVKRQEKEDPLPIWVYIVSISILVILILVLISKL